MRKKILVIGKIPPIQGGVSWQTLQFIQGARSAGHTVRVLTNSNEVEYTFRCCLLPEDLTHMETFLTEEDNIQIESISDSGHFHIPYSKTYESRLLGRGISEISQNRPDIIVGWYFQPYGIVASLLGRMFDIPVALVHAGSDIGRLAENPNLKDLYRELFKSVSVMVASRQKAVTTRLEKLGISKERFIHSNSSLFHTCYNNPEPLNLESYRVWTKKWLTKSAIPENLIDKITQTSLPSTDCPRICIYGKIGKTKGSYELVQALSELANEGVSFCFVTIALGAFISLRRFIRNITQEEKLLERTVILPPLPPWRIPSLIHNADITCYLENKFPISFHSPTVPREILKVGSCLVCSQEIIDKDPGLKCILVNEENFISIKDPLNIRELKNKLLDLLQNYKKTKEIAKRGFISMDSLEKYVTKKERAPLWEQIISSVNSFNSLSNK